MSEIHKAPHDTIFEALRGYVWVESIHQIPPGRLGNGMRILEQIS